VSGSEFNQNGTRLFQIVWWTDGTDQRSRCRRVYAGHRHPPADRAGERPVDDRVVADSHDLQLPPHRSFMRLTEIEYNAVPNNSLQLYGQGALLLLASPLEP
jgi:hypothetical protein